MMGVISANYRCSTNKYSIKIWGKSVNGFWSYDQRHTNKQKNRDYLFIDTHTQIYFTLKSISYKMTAMLYFLLFSFVSKNLTNYRRRHLKLFTNCHVSWDTLYIRYQCKKDPNPLDPPESRTPWIRIRKIL